MKVKNRVFCNMFLFIAFLSFTSIKGQILDDQEMLQKIKQGVDYIYNFEFRKAEEVYSLINDKYPNHPVPLMFKGMLLYWKYYPIVADSPARDDFEQTLLRCVEMSESYLKKNDEDAESLLAGVGAVGMLLLFYADNGLTRNVISLAPESYKFVMKSFNFTNVYNDFYFITGLYNYYREAYPDAHPVYKPVVIFFPRGDKHIGKKQLQFAADSSIFLKAESSNFLSWIYLNFENNIDSAFIYSKKLINRYSKNVCYNVGYTRNLLLVKQYILAKHFIDSLEDVANNKFIQAQLYILKGVLFEKKYHDDKKSRYYYQLGLQKISPYNDFGYEYASYAYFGLSRIYERKGESKKKRQYSKLAREYAAYEHINFDD